MKVVMKIVLLIGIVSLMPTGKEVFAENSLQLKIDAIPEGGTLHLKKAKYNERIVLKKSIQLSGERGTIFTVCKSKPVLTIKGKNVRVKGITINSCNKNSKEPVIYITGKNHRLENMTIRSGRVAVKLDNAEHTILKNIHVKGLERERGIDLWQSNFNTFSENDIKHVQDGFYMENSHYNTFIGNKISDSRYGLHVMFSDNIVMKDNISLRNFTGAMVMGTNHTTVKDNQLLDNNQNVNAQGLLLYDVHKSIVRNNLISNNRVGIYMEDSSENTITKNKITANFIGTQINKVKQNKIQYNSFIGNVNEVQAIKGTSNLISNNYWDGSWKLDTDGNGKSNLSYHADPYFLYLIDETPEYQLFFQDPGMILLQKILKSPERKLITDESPLMKSGLQRTAQAKTNVAFAWIISLAMIVGSLLLIRKGRNKL